MYIAPEKTRTPSGGQGASRRELIVGAALVGGSLLVGCSPADIMGAGAPKTDFGAFGPFIKIDADGAVTVMNKHQEMGQGNHAGLSAIVAEEMDADWSTVKVQHAAANAKVYANSLMGVQGTGGGLFVRHRLLVILLRHALVFKQDFGAGQGGPGQVQGGGGGNQVAFGIDQIRAVDGVKRLALLHVITQLRCGGDDLSRKGRKNLDGQIFVEIHASDSFLFHGKDIGLKRRDFQRGGLSFGQIHTGSVGCHHHPDTASHHCQGDACDKPTYTTISDATFHKSDLLQKTALNIAASALGGYCD